MSGREREAAQRVQRLHLDGRVTLKMGFELGFVNNLASISRVEPERPMTGEQRAQLWRVALERGGEAGEHELVRWAREELQREVQAMKQQKLF